MKCRVVIRGDKRIHREFIEAHCARLEEWFDQEGRFRRHGKLPLSRERLWNCASLLGHGDARYARLAEKIILGTPVDKNCFSAIMAAELCLRYRDRLSAPVYAHLKDTIHRHLVNLMDIRFGGGGLNNGACMVTFYFLAAGRILDGYEFNHPLASVREVYTADRIFAIGMNALRLLAYEVEHSRIAVEFNSPTYSPLSIYTMARIVELIDDAEAREMALKVESALWREMLEFYHPRLGLSCGPWSRAYRVDVLGQYSNVRSILCYAGISKDKSLVKLLERSHPDVVLHQDGDEVFGWSQTAWNISGPFHVPADALSALRRRTYPKRFEASTRWERFGAFLPKTKSWFSVQGGFLPGGETDVIQTQHADWSLGYRTFTAHGHSFPICLHYARVKNVRTMRDVRHVLATVVFHGAPEEWTRDQEGKQMEAINFNNAGRVHVREKRNVLNFEARPFPEFSRIPADEISVNSLLTLHFAPEVKMSLNGKPYGNAPISLTTRRAVWKVQDAGFEYEIAYQFPRPVEMRLYRWANFIRFAGFWYEGKKRERSTEELRRMSCHGTLTMLKTNGPDR